MPGLLRRPSAALAGIALLAGAGTAPTASAQAPLLPKLTDAHPGGSGAATGEGAAAAPVAAAGLPPAKSRLDAEMDRVCAAFAGAIAAAEAPEPVVEEKKSPDTWIATFSGRVEQLKNNKEIPDDQRKLAIDEYTRAIGVMNGSKASLERAAGYDREAAEAPARAKLERDKLAAPPGDVDVAEPPAATLADCERLFADRTAALEDSRKLVETYDSDRKKRPNSQVMYITAISKSKEELAEVNRKIEVLPPPQNEVDKARRSGLYADRTFIEAESKSNAARLRSFEATVELQSLKRENEMRRGRRLEKELPAWKSIVGRRRQSEDRQAARDARTQTERLLGSVRSPRFKEIADRNAELVALRQTFAKQLDDASASLETVTKTRAAVAKDWDDVQRTLGDHARNMIVGLVLRQKQAELPDYRRFERSIRQRPDEWAESIVEQNKLEEERSQWSDLDALSKELADTAVFDDEDGDPAARRRLMQAELQAYLVQFRDNYGALIGAKEKTHTKLANLEVQEPRLVSLLVDYNRYIAERILWVRSTGFLMPADAHRAGLAAAELARPRPYLDFCADFRRRGGVEAPIALVATAVFAALVVVRGRMRKLIRTWGRQASKPAYADFGTTVKSLALTFAMAAIGPLPIWCLAWRVGVFAETASAFWQGVAQGLWVTAMTYALLEFTYELCRSGGVGECHFGWSSAQLRKFRRTVRLVVYAIVPGVFLFVTLDAARMTDASNSLGRLAFIAAHLMLSLAGHRLLNLKTGLWAATAGADKPGGLWRAFRRPIHLVAVGEPLFLACLAAAGYYYTALQLYVRLEETVWVGGGFFVGNALMLRWLLVARRRLAIEQLRKKREASKQGDEAARQEAGATDIAAVNAQTRQLLHSVVVLGCAVAVWFVWIDVMPALKMLDQVVLWQVTRTAADLGEAAPAAGAVALAGKKVPVTLFDVMCAGIIVSMMIAAAKNLPGLLEMAVLRRLPLDSGGRYAITTVCRYAISIAGSCAALAELGLAWSNVQWLAAAMTVGLGFGLQEIFANFVSGLILLFERPIRVGDVVTIGDVSGKVSRIRTRATVITDWDRKELVVPNKDFITGKIINWTLSDPTLRVTVKVGVAYGSDVALVQRTLLDVARKQTNLLPEPGPSVQFDGFGPSSINFTLQAFIPHIEQSTSTKNALHANVEKAFREAEIDFASGQVDVHIRNLPDTALTRALADAAIGQDRDRSMILEHIGDDIPLRKGA